MRPKYISISLVVLIVGGIAGWFVRNDRLFLPPTNTSAPVSVRANSSLYQFINPLLYSNTPKDNSPQYKGLADSFSDAISTDEKSGAADDVSVYFQDLNSGRWTGVNEDDTYTPASMLKVVAMMAALKLAESDPSILDEKLYYQATTTEGLHYPPTDDLANGEYSVQDLIKYMIVYSDNSALDALLSDSTINNEFTQVYDLFRLPQASTTQADFMSPKSYSVVFRTLYNSTLFEWNLSEQVLQLLTQTIFNAGIVAGVPAGTPVAHKFGESNDVLSDGTIEHELHDCGIVYYPDDPYLLCVMTKGDDFTALQGVISDISKIAYNFTAE